MSSKRVNNQQDDFEGNKTYFEVMLNTEKNIWESDKNKKARSKRRMSAETAEIQRKMQVVLNKLRLTYQAKYVSMYLMLLSRSNWDTLMENVPRSISSLKSKEYINNILIISCIFISSNYEELSPPGYNKLINIIQEHGFKLTDKDTKITRRHVHIFEKLIWELTDFQVEIPSANSFLMQIIKYSKLPKEFKFKVSKISNDIINVSLGSSILFEYKQSMVAISSYLLAIKIMFKGHVEKYDQYQSKITKHSNYSASSLVNLRNKLEKIYLEQKGSN